MKLAFLSFAISVLIATAPECSGLKTFQLGDKTITYLNVKTEETPQFSIELGSTFIKLNSYTQRPDTSPCGQPARYVMMCSSHGNITMDSNRTLKMLMRADRINPKMFLVQPWNLYDKPENYKYTDLLAYV
ncbi:hypothetical protein PGTUg99_032244 [Puccinia graminis f. sp. tritici]|uniref:Uncharacterized protein n=1 Tax=Puccinia graminis f. sp. tritici TaxID=56615 RepID=A0A5B0LX94_PUCGR|nr:hypothetical protein PGTUg99_032244 [Puccinia graminis f. sp. tritici]